MAKYTYEDFENEANKYGMLGQFSEADLNLARNNADAGMSLLSYKRDYANAATDADRESANRGAEALRAAYGGYTGGVDGSKYYLNDTATATNPNTPMTWTNFLNFTGGQQPERSKEYENLYRDYLNQIINRDAFSYDAENDPNYLQYKNQYTREGNRAMQDTLGQISARSGGLASSYAGTAAQQANNYYMQQLADKIPELYQQAYNRYLKEFEMQMDTLGAIGNGRDYDLNAFGVDRDVYDTNRNFAYQQYGDAYNARMQEDQLAYDRAQQERENKMQDEALQRELADWYAQRGDYSYAQALGIDPSVYQKSSGGSYGGGGNRYSTDGVYSEGFGNVLNTINGHAKEGRFNVARQMLLTALDKGDITRTEYNIISQALEEEADKSHN